MPKTILCLGDSNTWGYDPRGAFGGRYPADVRWTARLAQSGAWVIHNLGENGREIPLTPFALDLIARQIDALRPIDGICVLLGANDLLCGAAPTQAAARMERLLDRLADFRVPVLLLAPPRFAPGDWVQDARLIDASAQLAGYYRTLAADRGLAFADAGAWDILLCFDGVHFTEEGHRRFAAQAQAAFTQAFGA
ncbi:GDSL-type esterase/lipase family protein [Agathobaculum sp. Marseille-P7918]|uniref:GDSL-type esterase/lipase family protein n=1 Tax=Agathobaculum sp. Marseille-P7918 TaxID=2479843 RepID=UPI000F62C6C4|nr:GDSL-type esterase/lipase family protein [Agathobaculum sp. Marseille-P7918]